MKPPRQPGASPPRPHTGFDIDRPLMSFGGSGYEYTWRQFFGSVILTGDTGSGKSTILRQIARAVLARPSSVVFSCVKSDDAAAYADAARASGRTNIRVLGVDDRINPLAITQMSPSTSSGLLERLVKIAAAPIYRQHRGGGGDSGFWVGYGETAMRSLMTPAILAGAPMSYRWLADSLRHLPHDPSEVDRSALYESCPAARALFALDDLDLSPAMREEADRAAHFMLYEAPRIPSKTRASLDATVLVGIDALTRFELGAILNGNEQTWTPEPLFTEPSVLILDYSTLTLGPFASTVQLLILTLIQNAALQRDLSRGDFPVVLFMDELQEILDPMTLPEFIRTARSNRCCAVMATQCCGNVEMACAEARDPKAASAAILGLPASKCFCGNTDPDTLMYSQRVYGDSFQPQINFGRSDNGSDQNRGRSSSGLTTNVSRSLLPELPASELTRLRRGGPLNDFTVEAFVSVSGRVWPTGRTSLKVAFKQSRS